MIDPYGNSSSVIRHRDRIILIDRHINRITMPCQCFIYRIIHNLIHKMMKSPQRGTADIHPRPLPDCFQPFQDLYLVSSIFRIKFRTSHTHSITSSNGKATQSLSDLCLFFYNASILYIKNSINSKPVADQFLQPGTGHYCLYIVDTVQ